MADWGPVLIGVVLFVLLQPGLVFQLPGNGKQVEFGSMKTNGKAIAVHTLIFFTVYSILILAVHVHIYTGWLQISTNQSLNVIFLFYSTTNFINSYYVSYFRFIYSVPPRSTTFSLDYSVGLSFSKVEISDWLMHVVIAMTTKFLFLSTIAIINNWLYVGQVKRTDIFC